MLLLAGVLFSNDKTVVVILTVIAPYAGVLLLSEVLSNKLDHRSILAFFFTVVYFALQIALGLAVISKMVMLFITELPYGSYIHIGFSTYLVLGAMYGIVGLFHTQTRHQFFDKKL
jgi:hypothetical protein